MATVCYLHVAGQLGEHHDLPVALCTEAECAGTCEHGRIWLLPGGDTGSLGMVGVDSADMMSTSSTIMSMPAPCN